eukprot:g1677.t1
MKTKSSTTMNMQDYSSGMLQTEDFVESIPSPLSSADDEEDLFDFLNTSFSDVRDFADVNRRNSLGEYEYDDLFEALEAAELSKSSDDSTLNFTFDVTSPSKRSRSSSFTVTVLSNPKLDLQTAPASVETEKKRKRRKKSPEKVKSAEAAAKRVKISRKQKKKPAIKKKKKKKIAKSAASEGPTENKRREIALKRQRTQGRFVKITTTQTTMTSATGKESLKFKTDLEPQSFSTVILGSSVQIGALFYVWFTQSSAKKCADRIGQDDAFATCVKEDLFSRQICVALGIILLSWVLSIVIGRAEGNPHRGTSDPSITDRLWSVLPPCYVAHCYLSVDRDAPGSSRLLAMTILSTAWSVRLTWNFWRKGGFSGGEDYRWEHLRMWFPAGWKWETFNFVFINCFQQLLIMGFTTPAVASADGAAVAWTSLDTFATALFVALLVGETVADNQMFEFQTEKYRRKAAKVELGDAYARGFLWGGLYRWSRHPNYFCEVSMWWAFYLFGVAAGEGPLVNWTILPVIYLTVLFVAPGASLDFAEALSSQKYREYAIYQQKVSRFFPWFPCDPPPVSAKKAAKKKSTKSGRAENAKSKSPKKARRGRSRSRTRRSSRKKQQ